MGIIFRKSTLLIRYRPRSIYGRIAILKLTQNKVFIRAGETFDVEICFLFAFDMTSIFAHFQFKLHKHNVGT